MMKQKNLFFFIVLVFVAASSFAQERGVNWTADGLAYVKFKEGNIIRVDPKTENETIVVKKESLIPAGASSPLKVQSFDYSADKSKILLFANTAKVWRYNTRGDYYILNTANNSLRKLGADLPSQSLMFAKFSPDSKSVAYVSDHNIYSEDVATGVARKLTADGTRKLINGTFDWVYEEEFNCRDGFRWSPDSRQIAYWQIDATKIRDYYMLNTTDSVYSHVVPVEYPKVGEDPSAAYIQVVTACGRTDPPHEHRRRPRQHYITRMEWSGPNELIVQQLDRKQQESKLMYCKTTDGSSTTFWAENDEAWVDLNTDDPKGWNWVNQGKDFLWVSEKDDWRHIYKISRDGKTITLLTKGNYDIEKIKAIDEVNNYIYFSASPNNATQLYLYRVRINDPKNEPELLSGTTLKGTHNYDISPGGKMASHTFSNHNTPGVREWITLPDNKPFSSAKSIASTVKTDPNVNVEYTQVTTEDGIVLDAWINKPKNFDPNKKYPVVLYVYGEPGAATVGDEYGAQTSFLYKGDIAGDGYVQMGLDNRGTPTLKGAKWRRSIYRKIGVLNIRDMAMGTKKLLEKPYMDKSRVAVWGWSGGGSSTLNLLFNYPEIFQTGIAIAPLTNLLSYDNIYEERYMGLPQENREDYIKGSAIASAKNLKGNLLYIHGTGDDNVHYDNAEMLVNELVKYNKEFQFMAYPNRTHNISEGPGTWLHLSTLYTNYLKKTVHREQDNN
jgi:dipeptidyl-peptidase-4